MVLSSMDAIDTAIYNKEMNSLCISFFNRHPRQFRGSHPYNKPVGDTDSYHREESSTSSS